MGSCCLSIGYLCDCPNCISFFIIFSHSLHTYNIQTTVSNSSTHLCRWGFAGWRWRLDVHDCDVCDVISSELHIDADDAGNSVAGARSCAFSQTTVWRFENLQFSYKNAQTASNTRTVASSNWRRGSVVRTSVCSWRTFPDLRLIHGWRVTTSWVRRPLWVNQPGQLSLPSLRGR